MTFIYVLSEIDGTPRYVGKTRQTVSSRVRGHRNGRDGRVRRWLRKRGDSYRVDVLEEATDSTWAERERFWIGWLQSLGFPLFNYLKGGDGAHKPIFTAEHRAKIGTALRTGREKPCEWCGSAFWAVPAKEKRGVDRFCGISCANRFKGSRRAGVPRPVVWAAVEAAATIRRARTHCLRGHEFTPDNTRLSEGRRICRACARERTRQSKERRKLRIDGSVNGR